MTESGVEGREQMPAQGPWKTAARISQSYRRKARRIRPLVALPPGLIPAIPFLPVGRSFGKGMVSRTSCLYCTVPSLPFQLANAPVIFLRSWNNYGNAIKPGRQTVAS